LMDCAHCFTLNCMVRENPFFARIVWSYANRTLIYAHKYWNVGHFEDAIVSLHVFRGNRDRSYLPENEA
jgi:hypothetical protein